jgi:hypothetical protein
MLDGGANPGAGRISALTLCGERLARCSAEVDFRHPAGAQDGPLVLLAAVGGICPDRAAGVGRIDQDRKLPAVVAGGIAGRPGADEALALVDADVRLVPTACRFV